MKKFSSLHGEKAINALLSGISKLARAVKGTMGPDGKLAMIRLNDGVMHCTKDGVTIASHFSVDDPFENMGVNAVMQASQHTAIRAGDGTTTSVVLTEAICKMCNDVLKQKACTVNELKKELNSSMEEVLYYLDQETIPCTELEKLISVGIIAANGDIELGKTIAEMAWSLGEHGSITVDSSGTIHNVSEVLNGYSFDRGMESNYFVNDASRGQCVFTSETKILICDYDINNPKDIFDILKELAHKNQPLLIVARDFDEAVLSTLVLNKVKSGIKVCAVKAPGFGKYQTDFLQDMALATDGTVISREAGMDLSLEFVRESLGTVAECNISMERTILVVPEENKVHISNKIQELKLATEFQSEGFEKDHLKTRIARLAGGVGKILIGASTELEMREKIDRADDAKEAVFQALKEGTLVGAGEALRKAGSLLSSNTVGNIVLSNALKVPSKQLEENSGPKASFILMSEEELVEAGILDAAPVVKNALINAVSTAIQVISTDVLLHEKPEE